MNKTYCFRLHLRIKMLPRYPEPRKSRLFSISCKITVNLLVASELPPLAILLKWAFISSLAILDLSSSLHLLNQSETFQFSRLSFLFFAADFNSFHSPTGKLQHQLIIFLILMFIFSPLCTRGFFVSLGVAPKLNQVLHLIELTLNVIMTLQF